MKDNIKTAWSYFAKNASENFIDSLSRDQLLIITKAMKEYASQFIDLAAEEAELEYPEYPNDGGGGYIPDINKKSILRIKELIK